MGGKSKSSNTTTTTTHTTTNTNNVSGSAAASGDNNGLMLSGVNDSNINVRMTDHGAMQRASDLSELALLSNADVTEEALWSMADVTESALAMGEHSVSEAMDFGRDAMAFNAEVSNHAIDEVSQAHHGNLQMLAGLAGNQAAQNSESLAALKDLAGMQSDGGQVATSRQMTIVVGLVMAFMAIMMFGGKR
ncbi:chemotaxis protein [Photobacterium satsumensis]|uniref:chemotaxis protein n=1 Tax=Photobacterium satsumensis TaxID=2910239 RepID=UPI003D0F3C76